MQANSVSIFRQRYKAHEFGKLPDIIILFYEIEMDMQDQSLLMDRIIALESSVMHLQVDLEKIGQVVLEQQQQIEQQQRQIARWEEKISRSQDEFIDPLDEKPPHY